ncbi:MAG: anhydro-N-acetylmuramic acid kinase [Planctomycetes bacterium]|nr:anhydro-N-acetylmuramic acid kinase [Planctomycetota bacterium]
MDRLRAILEKPRRRVIGLMSGTSVDGVDAALVEVEAQGVATRVRLVAHRSYPYSAATQARIHALFEGSVRDVCEMNFVLGGILAEAALRLCRDSGEDMETVDLIGSHGQTVCHITPQIEGVNSTLQIGEGAVIAERTGRVTVCDFRPRDIAAGGSGAPLVPYVDWLLFRRSGRVRALQNLGGIANVTVVTEDPSGVFAFDTGPCNMVLDDLARRVTGEPTAMDQDGKLSALGRVDARLLEVLHRHPYLEVAPPKSTGREVFGRAFTQKLADHYDPDRLLDLLATLCRFVAESIRDAYRHHVEPRRGVDEVLLSGGGAHNRTLVAHLVELFGAVPVRVLDTGEGVPSDAKEAVAFAVLANETVHGIAANLPGATGARHPVVLGKVIP